MSEKLELKLKNLPIFWMSLSSKELFHSNFISWILESYPKEMGSFFCQMLKLESVFIITKLKREKFNVDISFYLGDTIILIENKVKSIAYEEQLTEYNELYKNQKKEFILLSLKKPTIDIKNWKYLDYMDLLNQLEYLISNEDFNSYHKNLINDYVKFMRILSNEILPLINIEKIQISNLYKKETKENKLLEELTELRMHDFFLKGLFEDAAKFLKEKLTIENNLKITSKNIFKCTEKNIFSVTFGMSRAQGILDIKYKINSDFIIGIQIQGLQYRQFIESKNESYIKNKFNELLENKKWFSFSNQLKRNNNLEIYPLEKDLLNKNKEKFNKFDSSLGLFLYRSVKINSFNNKDLFEMICQDINDILEINNLYKREIE